jgi:hypothetical protein
VVPELAEVLKRQFALEPEVNLLSAVANAVTASPQLLHRN